MPDYHSIRRRDEALKRGLDVSLAALGIVLTVPVTVPALILATIDTRKPGLFRQERIGRHGEPFEVLKIRTMRPSAVTTTVTTSHDPRITRLGAVLRRLKIDELPQLINVLRGEMSLVGPRPDVRGFADLLEGEDRRILDLRPGITGPAALAYRHEQELLAKVADPVAYNRDVVWPDKVRINLSYMDNYSVKTDIRCIVDTVASIFKRGTGQMA